MIDIHCTCGVVYPATTTHISMHRRNGTLPRCPDCVRKAKAEAARRGRPRRGDAIGRPSRKLVCKRCYDLPDCRPSVGLCLCGLPYAEEPPVTLAEILERAVGESRVWPGKAGY